MIATGPLSVHQAQLLAEWGRVTIFLNGALELDEEQARELAARGVTVNLMPVVGITDEARVQLSSGRSEDFAGLFTASRTAPPLLLFFRRRLHWCFTGVDPSRAMLELCGKSKPMKARSSRGLP